MEALKTVEVPFSLQEILGNKISKEDKKLIEAELSFKKMYCTQQKLFTLTNMLSAGVMRAEGDFVPSIEDGRDRLKIINKILSLVAEF